MNASAQSTVVSSPDTSSEAAKLLPSHENLLSIGAVSLKYGVSICKLRLATRSGALPCLRIPGNGGNGHQHRRFSENHIRKWLRIESREEHAKESNTNDLLSCSTPTQVRIALVARTSGYTKENDEGQTDLSRQIDRLNLYADTHFPGAVKTLHSRVASGINLSNEKL
jgi:hypothetical protein